MKFKKFNVKVSLLIKISLLNIFKVKKTLKLKKVLFSVLLAVNKWNKANKTFMTLQNLIKSLKMIKFLIKTFNKRMLLIVVPVEVLTLIRVVKVTEVSALLCDWHVTGRRVIWVSTGPTWGVENITKSTYFYNHWDLNYHKPRSPSTKSSGIIGEHPPIFFTPLISNLIFI